MKVGVIGHSHIACMAQAVREGFSMAPAVALECVQLRTPSLLPVNSGDERPVKTFDPVRLEALLGGLHDAAATVLQLRGNEHSMVALIAHANLSITVIERRIRKQFAVGVVDLMTFLRGRLGGRLAVLPPPPPVESDEHIRRYPGVFAQRIAQSGISPFPLRLHASRVYVSELRQLARELDLPVLELPEELFSEAGGLATPYLGRDATHANADCGRLLLERIARWAMEPVLPEVAVVRPPVAHPYVDLPAIAFWKDAVEECPASQLDPLAQAAFRIAPEQRIASAGSCFAQHISRHLRQDGYRFLVTEEPAAGAADGFSARYGNIYTARQLWQLFERAFGRFAPVEDVWELPSGGVCDPFRPRVQAGGYPSVEALRCDREGHFAAVRRMFEELDVFVFTLGLTESWCSREDGAVFPLAPGVAGGRYDPVRHAFVNVGVDEVVADLRAFLRGLRHINPRARVVLTVSPVPLAATWGGDHVLSATTLSKSVLRVAADAISRSEPEVMYFPSYELITSSASRGAYFGRDLRQVTDAGVAHVMRVFMARATERGAPGAIAGSSADGPDDEAHEREMERLAEADCDEALLGKLRG